MSLDLARHSVCRPLPRGLRLSAGTNTRDHSVELRANPCSWVWFGSGLSLFSPWEHGYQEEHTVEVGPPLTPWDAGQARKSALGALLSQVAYPLSCHSASFDTTLAFADQPPVCP